MARNPQTSAGQRNPPPPRPQPEGPRAVALSQSAPTGRKLVGNIGPGLLRPGAGKQVQRTQQPLICGTMTGQAFDFTEHPNVKDPKRLSTRFVGEVLAIDHTGKINRGAEWYLPPTVTRAVKAALKVNNGHPVPFSIEVWCEPDQEGRPASPLGYSYVSYDRIPARDNDPLMMLAYETGILERPSGPALTAPETQTQTEEEYDPETGEILLDTASAA